MPAHIRDESSAVATYIVAACALIPRLAARLIRQIGPMTARVAISIALPGGDEKFGNACRLLRLRRLG
jgi:hypothetical protein